MGLLEEWSVDDCFNALYEEPWVDRDFLQLLRHHAIDGKALLELTKDDLKEDFGIQKVGHIKSILRNIRRLERRLSADPGEGRATDTALPAVVAVAGGDNSKEGNRFFPFADSVSRDPGPTADSAYYNTPSLNSKVATPKRFQAPSSQEDSAPLSLSSVNVEFDAEPEDCRDAPQLIATQLVRAGTPQTPPQKASLPDIFAGGGSPFSSPGRTLSSLSAGPKSPQPTSPLAASNSPRAAHLNLSAAKAKGRKHRAREERDREERLNRGEFKPAVFEPGLLETVRRQDACRKLFLDWSGKRANAIVPKAEVEEVVQLFANAFMLEWGIAPPPPPPAEPSVEIQTGEEAPAEAWLTLDDFVDLLLERAGTYTPTTFDDLIVFIYNAVGDQDQQRLLERRAVLSQLFGAKTTEIDRADLKEVVDRFNNWVPGETWLLLDTSRYDLEGPDPMPYGEFENMLIAVTQKFPKDDFDEICFRLGRCQSSVQQAKHHAGVGVLGKSFDEELRRTAIEATGGQPILLYSVQYNPAQNIEVLARQMHCSVKGVVVTDEASAATAISTIRYNGLQRGRWIYTVLVASYGGTDRFLRDVALLVETKHAWMVHPRFRLFAILCEDYVLHLPRIFVSKCVQIAIADHLVVED